MYKYKCTVVRWIDGDTLEVMIDLGFFVNIKQTIRLFGVNAPELRSKNLQEKALAKKALDLVQSTCPVGTTVIAETTKPNPRDKYGRFLANLILPDKRSLNEILEVPNYILSRQKLAKIHYENDPSITDIYNIENVDDGWIGLLEIDKYTPKMGVVILRFDKLAMEGINHPSIIIVITPQEFEDLKAGKLSLPKNWTVGERINK